MTVEVTELFNIFSNVWWGAFVANYFFLTGLSAGSFILGALAEVFGFEKYRSITRIAIILATIFLFIAPLNLIADLEQTGRWWTLFFNTHATSPMSWGVFLLTTYPLLCLSEAYFMFREDNARTASTAHGAKATLYKILSLGRTEISENSIKIDKRLTKTLAAIGVPLALAVHGYTGYILGVVVARNLWSTPQMPVIFLLSAMVSGIAFVTLVVYILQRFFTEAKKVNKVLMGDLGSLLAGFIFVDLLFIFFEISMRWYSYALSRESVIDLFTGPTSFYFVWIELIFGAIVPLILLISPIRRKVCTVIVSSILAVAGVIAMRMDFVVGGQFYSRIGTLDALYTPSPLYLPPGSQEMLPIIGIWALGFFFLALSLWILPWRQPASGGT